MTLSLWQEMRSLPDELSDTERTIEAVAILMNKVTEDVRALTDAELDGIRRYLSWMNEPIPADPQFDITVGETCLALINTVSDIEIGAWADLQRFIKEGALLNLHFIHSILYLRYTLNEFGDRVLTLSDAGESKSLAIQVLDNLSRIRIANSPLLLSTFTWKSSSANSWSMVNSAHRNSLS